MKKNQDLLSVKSGNSQKILLKMKFTLFFLMVFVFQVSATVYSQATKFNFDIRNEQIAGVLKQIESTSNFRFFFQREQVDVNRPVDLTASNNSVEEILDKLFKDQHITYRVLEDDLVLLLPEAYAKSEMQQATVTGKVTDSQTGEAMPGVNIVVKGTVIGTMTDETGNFLFTVNDRNATLVFSFVGYATQEIALNGRSSVNVSLTHELLGLDEVVVVGYGTMRKSDLTGSATRIDLSKSEMRPNTNLTEVLSGRLAGVNASSGSLAGSSGVLNVRGKTSLSASETPLIVLDGIIYNGSISNLNINDIESIDVLKDASAAAVYGARSANGVLLINTKRGRSEKPMFEFNVYYGYQNIGDTKRTEVMNGEEFAISRVYHSYHKNLRTWYQTNPTDASERPLLPDLNDRQLVSTYLRTQEEKDNYLLGKETNWVDEVLQVAPIQNYNINVSGSSGRTNYFLSGSYTDQKGILLNDRFKRQTLRANFDNQITDWFSIKLNTSYSHLDNSGLNASLALALLGSPFANIYTSDGKFTNNLAGDPYVRNPLEDISVDNTSLTDNLNIALSGKLNIPWIEGLTYEINYSRSLFIYKNSSFYPSTHTTGLPEQGRGVKDINETQNWLWNNILTYKKTFNNNNRVDFTLVYTKDYTSAEGSLLESSKFNSETLGYHALELGTNQKVNTAASDESNLAFMTRANYTYRNRYIITATFRRDGYSGFGIANKYANFPSIGIGWIVSEEAFMKNIDWLNTLKVRLSYGLNGNQGIGAYSSLARMGTTYYVYGGSSVVGIYPNSLGNAGLKWETTATFNLGLDYSVLDRRISGELDIYTSRSYDVLVQRTVPQSTGYAKIWDNVSEIKNRGIEFAVNTENIRGSVLNWNTRFSFSMIRNEIVSLYEGVTEDRGNRWFVGYPISAHFDYQVQGVWQEEELFKGEIIPSYLPGDMKLADLNNDKKIDDKDRSIIGYPDPNYRFGIYNDVTFKNFTLSLFINSIQGGNGYYIDNPGEDASRAGGADRALRTNRTALFKYWTPQNPVNDQPAMFYPWEGLHGMYFDRSFVRLQDVSLSYNLKIESLKRINLSDLQVYMSGKNLHTWTKWPSYDPELNEGFPMMRNFIMGLKINF